MSKKNPSPGEAFRVALASIIFAFSAQIGLGVIGLIVAIIYRQGAPLSKDWWMILGVSLLPWAIVVLQTIHSATGGLSGAFPRPNPTPPPAVAATTQKHDLRMIPVYRQNVPTLNGVDVQDLKFFIRRICATRDWTQRAWRGARMPSGYPCDNEYHRQMMEILKQAGFIIGHKPRSSGRLLCYDPEQIIDHLELDDPVRSYQRDSGVSSRYSVG